MKTCLVFGGSGAIGSAVAELYGASGHTVWTTTRKPDLKRDFEIQIIGNQVADSRAMESLPELDSVVWAQGANLNDSIFDLDVESLSKVIESNLMFVASTMQSLISTGRIRQGSRLCVISSIWQEVTRTNKFSYSISKAAIGALVRSAAIDLSSRGILVNAVLPGVLDTPMTRSMLTEEQLKNIELATGLNRLVTPTQIARVVEFLCSDLNMGVSGQSIVVDLGFSNAKQL
jgi:NAD(P)-dependent dehydrogenase (short-subunit alcohol dehydrogenase family)